MSREGVGARLRVGVPVPDGANEVEREMEDDERVRDGSGGAMDQPNREVSNAVSDDSGSRSVGSVWDRV